MGVLGLLDIRARRIANHLDHCSQVESMDILDCFDLIPVDLMHTGHVPGILGGMETRKQAAGACGEGSRYAMFHSM